VAAGWNHTCAVNRSGGVFCWGWNLHGQLGDGTNASRATPAQVYALEEGVEALSVGWAHTCAVTVLGGVKCWGANDSGQLGDGTNLGSQVPQAVVGLGDGTSPGRVISPTTTTALKPTATGTPRPASTSVLSISAGNLFACALMSGGGVKCWGSNFVGELGDGSTTDSTVPVTVKGLGGPVTAIATSIDRACAIITDGTIYCWGRNSTGEMGKVDSSNTPVRVENMHEPVQAIALGARHTCVLTVTGGVKCWGRSAGGLLGDGTNTNSQTPVDVVGLSSGVTAISARYYSTCALTDGGAVKCWGRNTYGMLGDGTTTDRNAPVNVMGLTSGSVSISMGGVHACALMDTGAASCWGDNSAGQLGNGTTSKNESPVPVIEPAKDFLEIRANDSITCARTKAGGVKCWGADSLIFMDKSDAWIIHNRPVDIIGLSSGVAVLEVGTGYACTISIDAIAKCWGRNAFGTLGDGTTVNRYAPGVVVI